MGCGATKLENFEGPPDEEILFHAKSILLASQSGEKGSGPETRVLHALNGCLKAVEVETAQIYPHSLHKLAAAIESLRLEAPHIFMKVKDEIIETRVAIYRRVVMNPEESDGGREEKKWASLPWIPRVVSLEPTSINYLGTSSEYGLTGSGAASLGFCVEAWVWNNKLKKQLDGNLFTLISDSAPLGTTATGALGREMGMSPSMYADDDGRLVMDFFKKQCISTKSDLFSPNEWVHVAFVYGSDQMKVYVNGTKVGSKESSPPMGQVSLSLCSGLSGHVCEMRIWMCERTDDEIKETMNKSITPFQSKLYPGLRLCWMPVATGSPLYPPGALLYDCWRQQFVGCRKISSQIVDNRWPSVIPPQLIPDQNYLYASHYCDEIADLWEKFHVDLFVSQPIPSKFKPDLSILEVKALQIMNILLGYGGPWIPRVVCLAPNSSVCLGTTDELGLSITPTTNNSSSPRDGPAFTLECWVRLRILNPHGNNLLDIGRGDAITESQIIQILLKNGCPSFTMSGKTIESDVGLPMMKWTHLAFVFDSRHQQIYANGTLIASSTTAPLTGSNTIIFGSADPKRSFSSDLCELRVWNRALTGTEINDYMQLSIPPLGGKGHRNLRLTWLPLRTGGPFAQETWCRRKLMLNKMKPLTQSALKYLNRPSPTLMWDVSLMRDVGTFVRASDPLLTSRTRFIHIPHLVPSLDDLPQYWSKAAVAVIDEWTDVFDRSFVPKWYEVPQINEADHEAFAQIPINASEAVMRSTTWIGRVMKTHASCNYSVPIGLTAELGLCGVATGGREFTLELWIKTKGCDEEEIKNKKIVFEDILGHEDKESNESTGFLGMGSPFALRIGLANGLPFMNFLGQIKSLKASDLKEGVIASTPLVPGKWTHLAFVAIGDGKIVLYVNGEEVCRRERMNPLQAKGDTMIQAFGYEDRLLQSDLCEMRLWSTARTPQDLRDNMMKCISPLPTGLARVPDLRLAWFPTNSMRSVFWDHKYMMTRGVYPDLPSVPKYSRRPLSLPPAISSSLISLPPCYILDDRGDSYERHLSSHMLPPVVRLEDGTVDYTHYDASFEPMAKKVTSSAFASTGAREEIDLGWGDTDDGLLLPHMIHLDDGGWMESWDKQLLAKFQEEEAVDVMRFVPPAVSRVASRSPSIADSTEQRPNGGEELFEGNLDGEVAGHLEGADSLEGEAQEGGQNEGGGGREEGERGGNGDGGIEDPMVIQLGSPKGNEALSARASSQSQKYLMSPAKQDECRSNPDEVKEQESPISVVDGDQQQQRKQPNVFQDSLDEDQQLDQN
jgi:hypothetical protein